MKHCLCWVWALFFLAFLPPAAAQSNPFRPVLSYGRGVPQSAYWQPGGDRVLVNSVTGAWLYSGDDLADIAHFETLRDAQFSRDGRWLFGTNEGGEAEIYDMTTFEMVVLPEAFGGTTFSPDGRWLLGRRAEQPVLLDTDTFQPVDLPAEYAAQPVETAFIWSPDSQKLAAWEASKRLLIWQVDDSAPPLAIQTDFDGYPDWSPNSQRIMVNQRADNRVQIWDANTGALSLEIGAQDANHSGQVADNFYGIARWKPGGGHILRYYLTQQVASTMEINDAITGETIAELAIFANQIEFRPDGKRLALTNLLYDTDSYERTATLDLANLFNWSPDSQWMILTYAYTSDIKLLDGFTGEEIRLLQGHVEGVGVRSAIWSPDSGKLLSWDDPGDIILWDVLKGDVISRLDDHMNLTAYSAFNADGSLLASADSVGNVRLWNTQTGDLIAILTDHRGEVDTLLWQPGGNLLATHNASSKMGVSWNGIDDRNSVHIWNGETGERIHTITRAVSLASATWNPDGTQLLVGNEADNNVIVWDAASGDESRIEVQIGQGVVSYPRISWSPDGNMLLLNYSVAAFRLYGAHSGDLLGAQIRYFSSAGYRYTWSPDNQKLRLASLNCPANFSRNCSVGIRVIFDRSRPPLDRIIENTFDLPVELELGTFDTPPALFWSPNGKWIATLTGSVLQIWDVERKISASLARDVKQIMWSPDGDKLAIIVEPDAAEVINLSSGGSVKLGQADTLQWLSSNRLVTGYQQEARKLWDAETGELIVGVPFPGTIVTSDGSLCYDFSGGVVRVWARE